MEDLIARLPTAPTAGASLSEGIRRALGDAITAGDLPPGTRLTEISLAAHFGCSTTPVREAIRKLEGEGLVRIYPRRGAEVISFRLQDVRDLYEVRMALECHAIRRAAERPAPRDEVKQVRELIDRQRATPHDEQHHSPMDAQVHSALASLSGNEALANLVGTTTRQIEAVQARAGAWVDDPHPTIQAHEDILAAVAEGDGALAERLMRDHLSTAAGMVLGALTRVQASRP